MSAKPIPSPMYDLPPHMRFANRETPDGKDWYAGINSDHDRPNGNPCFKRNIKHARHCARCGADVRSTWRKIVEWVRGFDIARYCTVPIPPIGAPHPLADGFTLKSSRHEWVSGSLCEVTMQYGSNDAGVMITETARGAGWHSGRASHRIGQ